MSRHTGHGHRYCKRGARIDLASFFDEEPDIEFVDRMVALYRKHFDGPTAVGPTNG
jgi:hypothetical protein